MAVAPCPTDAPIASAVAENLGLGGAEVYAVASTCKLHSRGRLIEILLEPAEHRADLVRIAEVVHGIGNGVMVLELEQRGQLVGIQLADTLAHIMAEGLWRA